MNLGINLEQSIHLMVWAIRVHLPYPTTAYEIGSGTTIMSYEGLCNDDNNVTPNGLNNDYFHIISIQQMMNYIQ